jgi:hypothetical protein
MMDTMATDTFTDTEPALASDETVINGAPFVMRRDAGVDASADRNAPLNDHGPDLDDWLDETEALGKT